jgi:hypothetical protein
MSVVNRADDLRGLLGGEFRLEQPIVSGATAAFHILFRSFIAIDYRGTANGAGFAHR